MRKIETLIVQIKFLQVPFGAIKCQKWESFSVLAHLVVISLAIVTVTFFICKYFSCVTVPLGFNVFLKLKN